MRVAYVAETWDEVMAATAPGLGRSAQWASGNVYRMRAGIVTEDELDQGDLEFSALNFQLKHNLVLVGTPETVASIWRCSSTFPA